MYYILILLAILGGTVIVIVSILRDGKERGWVSNADLHGLYFLLPQGRLEAMRSLHVRDVEDSVEYEVDDKLCQITFFPLFGQATYQLSFTTLGRQTILSVARVGWHRSRAGVKLNRFFMRQLNASPVDAALFQHLRNLPLPPDAERIQPHH